MPASDYRLRLIAGMLMFGCLLIPALVSLSNRVSFTDQSLDQFVLCNDRVIRQSYEAKGISRCCYGDVASRWIWIRIYSNQRLS